MRMQPELKYLSISHPDCDFDTFVADDPHHFMLAIDAAFGPKGVEGAEIFTIYVCTPSWVAKKVNEKIVYWPRHYLIVNCFDAITIRAFITEYANQCVGDNWREIAFKLSRLGYWEFEDYKP